MADDGVEILSIEDLPRRIAEALVALDEVPMPKEHRTMMASALTFLHVMLREAPTTTAKMMNRTAQEVLAIRSALKLN